MSSNIEFLKELEDGTKRVVVKRADNEWHVDVDVKKRILEVFATDEVIDMPNGFCDKESLAPRKFSSNSGVRMVPGGTSVRAGSYVGDKVVIMPPAYVNIGAYIDSGSMIDSNALVGSCAYIGKNVHVSAGVQIGGVLEPLESSPVIVEDNCFLGGGSIIVGGVLLRERVVLAPGVILSASVPIYDVINGKIYKGEIPEGAVVVAGNRKIDNITNNNELDNLSIGCAVIVKYRDRKTDAAVSLNDILR